MKRILASILVLSLSFAGSIASAGAATSGVERAENVVLVKFRDGVSPSARADALESVGGRVANRLSLIGVDVVVVPGDAGSAVATLERNPGVVYAERNILKHAIASLPNDSRFSSQWALNQSNDADVDGPEGWAGAYGTDSSGNTLFPTTLGGPVIGIIDTGIDSDHPDLSGKLAGCASALTGLGIVTSGGCEDDNGHGTHVSGIASALTNNSTGIAGVAPDAKIAMCKALNAVGSGFLADVDACMEWLASRGVAVISMSLGGGKSDSEQQTVTKIWKNGDGTLMVAAAGNDGNSKVTYPAGYAEVVSVASTTKTDERSSFSNYNSDVEVAAPGSDILSTYLAGTYATASGTSMATPHAAGVAGMIKLENPTFDGGDLRSALDAAVDDLGAAGRDVYFGYGRVNLAKAVGGGASEPPPAEDGAVTGTVKGGKKALSGATVSWSGPESGSTTTDSAGTYLASALTPGTYTFTASATGCSSKSATVSVTSGQTTTQDFRLRC